MARTAELLIEEALTLDEDARTKIVDALLSSLDDAPGEPFDAVKYQAILERRIQELRSGSVEGVPLEALRAAWLPTK